MPRGVPLRRCKICGEYVDNRWELSARGKHLHCSQERQREEIAQMVEARGEHYRHWQQQCKKAFRWVTLDEDAVTP